MPVASPASAQLFTIKWPAVVEWFQWFPFLGSITRAAHRTQKNILLNRLPFFFFFFLWKDITQEQSDAQGKVGRKRCEFPCSLSGRSPLISMCSPARKLSETSPFGFFSWGLHYTGNEIITIGDWTQSQALFPPQRRLGSKGMVQSSNSPVKWLVLLETRAHFRFPRRFQMSPH